MFSLAFNINFTKETRSRVMELEREEGGGGKASIFTFIEQRFHVFLINKMKTINQNLLRPPPRKSYPFPLFIYSRENGLKDRTMRRRRRASGIYSSIS